MREMRNTASLSRHVQRDGHKGESVEQQNFKFRVPKSEPARRKNVRRARRRMIRRIRVATFLLLLFVSVMGGFISLAKDNRREACDGGNASSSSRLSDGNVSDGTLSDHDALDNGTLDNGTLNSEPSQYYKTIIIRPGETLWNIAETYCTSDKTLTDYIDAIKKMNHLKGDTIYAGERILVICQNLDS